MQNHDEETKGPDRYRRRCTITITISFHTIPVSHQRWTAPMEDHGDATRVKSPDLTGMDYRISIARGFHAASTLGHQMATTRMDEALRTWRQRHAIDDNAYRELLSILDPPKIPESCTSNGDSLSENLQFVSGSWNNPRNLQIDASSLSTSALSQIDYNLQFEVLTEPNSTSNWPDDHFAPVNHDFNFLDGDGQLFQGMGPTQLLDKDTLYFCSSNISTDLIPAPQQLAQIAPPFSKSDQQKEPACIRCWKSKKAV